jgi:hypothetical protein
MRQHEAPEAETVDKDFDPSKLNRQQRRAYDKHQAAMEELQAKNRIKSVKGLMGNVAQLLRSYTDGYNNHVAQNPQNQRNLKHVDMPLSLQMAEINMEELMGSATPDDIKRLAPCVLAGDPTKVRTMYLRVDSEFVFTPEADIEERPGVPEHVEVGGNGNKSRTQLFYHAVYPMENESEDLQNKAKEKLLADFITHIFCMGLDMQQINNNNMWQSKLNRQTETMHDKAAEVEELFSKIGAQNENMQATA